MILKPMDETNAESCICKESTPDTKTVYVRKSMLTFGAIDVFGRCDYCGGIAEIPVEIKRNFEGQIEIRNMKFDERTGLPIE